MHNEAYGPFNRMHKTRFTPNPPAHPNAMRNVYFDTNIYSDIAKTDRGVTALRADLALCKIVARLSIVNVEELLGDDWDMKREQSIKRLRVARDLVGFDSILKEPNTLLKEAIEAYATGAPPPSPMLPRHQRRHLSSRLHKVANGHAQLDPIVSQIVKNVRREKEAFKTEMMGRLAQALDELTQKYERRDLAEVPFEEYWSDATLWAKAFADHFGLGDMCQQRGLEGLLEVRAVRLCVGAAKSFTYSQVAQGGQPQRGDWHDVWHAILASVADVFVTSDRRLAKGLARVPGNDCRVVTSLNELLAD